jgi:acyl-CoA synthetase (AMP-forming)/AMP-acid ligase II
VDRQANRTARTLAAAGVGDGDRVVSWTDISLRSLDTFFATARLGAAFAPLNPSLSAGEAEDVIGYLRPRLLIADVSHAEPAAAVARALDLPLAVCGARASAGGGPGAGSSSGAALPGTDLDAATAAASGDALDGPEPAAGSAHIIFLTSGSTGRPKGVVLSHYASWMRAVPTGGATRMVAPGGGGDLCPFPLFHMAGWNAVLCAWSLLRPIHLVTRADGEVLVAEVARHRPVSLYCIPAVWRRVFDAPRGPDLSSLRYAMTGTSLVSEELLLELRDRLPRVEITISYGSTEMGVATTLGDHDVFRKIGSIGPPNPSFEARLDDGELCLRGETVMTGYFELPDETAAVLVDGWYRTGDLADMDDEGYLTITGRRREIIRSGGETIAPSEVEAAIAGLAGVQEVAVVGLPDDSWGEIVCAAFVLSHGADVPSVETVRAHLGTRLAAFKHPRAVTTVEALPRTPATGQVQRSKVRAELLERGL